MHKSQRLWYLLYRPDSAVQCDLRGSLCILNDCGIKSPPQQGEKVYCLKRKGSMSYKSYPAQGLIHSVPLEWNFMSYYFSCSYKHSSRYVVKLVEFLHINLLSCHMFDVNLNDSRFHLHTQCLWVWSIICLIRIVSLKKLCLLSLGSDFSHWYSAKLEIYGLIVFICVDLWPLKSGHLIYTKSWKWSIIQLKF